MRVARVVVIGMALSLLAAPAHAADMRRLEVRTQGASLRLVLHADSPVGATAVSVRGHARVGARAITLRLLRCPDARCAHPRPGTRPVRRLRRGLHAVSINLRSAPAPFARIEVRAGRRRVGVATLRPSRAASPPPLAPTSAVPAAAQVSSTAEAPTRVALSTNPPLRPAFDPAISDYTVACEPRGRAHLYARVPPGQTLAVDGGSARSGALSEDVALRAEQAFGLIVEGGDVQRTYSVRCVPSDFPGWSVQRDGDPQAGWLVFNAKRGDARYVVIADSNGVPMWWRRVLAAAVGDVKLLPDDSMLIGRSDGAFSDNASFEHLRLDGADLGSLRGAGSGIDIHDIQQLPNGNSLMLAYVLRRHVDLSSLGGPTDAEALDGELREVTAGGDLVWTWSSADHIDVAETGQWGIDAARTTYEGRTVFDLVHLNSAEQTGDAIVFSARHLDAVYRIRRSDGAIDWKLGGTHRPESLGFVGDPFGSTSFGGQHDARVLPDGTMTLHDNGGRRSRPPRAVRYRVDPLTGTATWVEQVTDRRIPASFCCGSARRLPGGDWVMSWGSTPVITELTPAGDPVLTLTLDEGFSYRAQPLAPGQLDRTALRDGMDSMHPR